MRMFPIVGIVCSLFTFLYAGEQIKGVITEIVDDNNRKAVLIDIDNTICKEIVVASMASDRTVLCYSQRDNEQEDDGPLLVQKRNGRFFDHDNFGKDMGIGAALCAAGCLFVLATGEPTQKPAPDGFYATVGEKSVYGAPACIVGIIDGAGCLFLIKGIIEVFMPRQSRDYGTRNKEHLQNADIKGVAHSGTIIGGTPISKESLSSSSSTDEIIVKGNFKVVNRIEKVVTIEQMGDLEAWVKRYCLSI